MAWILLNIHRATEAMGRAAVFFTVQSEQPGQLSLSGAGISSPENVLTLIMRDKEMRTMIKQKVPGLRLVSVSVDDLAWKNVTISSSFFSARFFLDI